MWSINDIVTIFFLLVATPAAMLGLRSSAFAGTSYLATPTPCCKVEKVVGAQVFLHTTKADCIQVESQVDVAFPDDTISEVEIFVDGQFWKKQSLKKFDMAGINGRLEQTNDLAEKMDMPQNRLVDQGQKEAQKVIDYYNSPAYQEKIAKEKNRLAEEFFKDNTAKYYSDATRAMAKPASLAMSERIYVFFSHSVPEQTLKNYLSMISKTKDPNIVMVMRGFIGGGRKIVPTKRYIQGLLLEDPACESSQTHKCKMYAANIEIDPLLFLRYNIQEVPAVVFATGVAMKNTSEDHGSEGNPEKADVQDFWTVLGDAPLDYVLERINVESKSANLDNTIHLMRSGFYD